MQVSYPAKKAIVLSSLLFYCVVSMTIAHRGPWHLDDKSNDVYPFFSWSLFPQIPNAHTGLTIMILSIGRDTYTPPLEFSKTSKLLFAQLHQAPTEYTSVINALGRAIIEGDTSAIATNRERLEKIFLGKSARYQVVLVTYDPVEYWKYGTFSKTEVLATYDVPAV